MANLFIFFFFCIGFKKSMNTSLIHSDIDVICVNFKKLHELLSSGIEDNLHSVQLAENLVTISLNHSYDLLDNLYQSYKLHSWNLIELLEQRIMKSVVCLRSYMYHSPETLQEEKVISSLPTQLEGMSSSTIEMWQLWTNLPDEEIIYQAVDHGFIPLAQTFFVSARNKTLKQATEYIETTVNDWVHRLLCEYQLTQCHKIFKNMVTFIYLFVFLICILNLQFFTLKLVL
jgi:hypothetical protein